MSGVASGCLGYRGGINTPALFSRPLQYLRLTALPPYRLTALPPYRLPALIRNILPQGMQQQENANGTRAEEAEHGKSRIPPDPKRGLDPHQQGCPYDQRGEDEADGDPIGHLLQPYG